MSAPDTITEIKDRVNFIDLVEETLPLKRRPTAGKPAMALCPFHQEKSPSMAIYPDSFHCFGCHRHGDIFDWWQYRYNLDFRQALEDLARRAGVDLQPLTPEQRHVIEARRACEDALKVLADHWAARLLATPAALKYTEGRAWTVETLRAESVGYADGGALPKLGNDQAQKVAEAVNRWAGKHGGALVYIHRDGGRVVYLAARAITEKEHYNPPADLAGERPPYLNAAYTRNAAPLVIVEGQACAVTLGGWGIPALALAGSGATKTLTERLQQHAARGPVYVVPDGDGKTNLAALAEVIGPEMAIIALPEGVKDVNDLAQNGATAEDFRKLWGQAETWLERLIEAARAEQGAARDRVIEGLFPWLVRLSGVAQARYKRKVVKAFPDLGARDYERLLQDARQAGRREGQSNGNRYLIAEGCHCAVKYANGEPYTEPLCNFTAEILEDVARDDGAGTPARAFSVRGQLADGTPLPAGAVDAGKFATLNWVNELWGVRAVIRAGRDTKDRLREAVQLHSESASSRYIYTHTGWREIAGKPVYLTGAGALGGDGVTVELDRELSHYRLPLQPENVAEAMRASLRFLELAPLEITVPLWAAAYLAPLAEIVYPGFMLWLYGKTGTLKSTLAALTMCHYGDFTDKTLFNWGDTANRLEMNCFLLKDTPMVIDDFAPQSDPFKAREMERNAAQIVRNVGNQAGRGRLRRDLSMAVTYRPRGLVISTGEQVPDGQSISARIFTLEVHPDDVITDRLTAAQAEAGRYPHALAGYLLWLAGRWQDLTEHLPGEMHEIRDRARVKLSGLHLRLPEALAQLYMGFQLGLQFAVEAGALTEAERAAWLKTGWEALKSGAEAQAMRVEKERPTVRFLEVLTGLLIQGKVHLERTDGKARLGGGAAGDELLGWYDDGWLYLLFEAAYNRVARFLRDEGNAIPVKQATLKKYLIEEGVLHLPESRKDDGRMTEVLRINDTTRRVTRLLCTEVARIGGELPPETLYYKPNEGAGTEAGG